MNNRCETCRWWGAERAHKPDQPFGTCRTQAPQPQGFLTLESRGDNGLEFYQVSRGIWPWTAFDDWCGGFSARPFSPSEAGGPEA